MHDDLTPREVAEELGVTVRTVQRWIADGRLPARRVGARVRVSRSSLSAVATRTPGEADTPVHDVHPPVRRVMIANRGEIAVRIARTARALGITVVAVHEPGDRAPDADEVHRIGSYLDADELLAVARATRADAVHPGYGFLAENSAFAAAVRDAGMAWVGPPATAIASMGDKAAARRLVASHGVPTVDGYDEDDQNDARLTEVASRIGWPLLVKPSAGGGGKGMRVVRAAGDLPEALAGARREAMRSFGDDRLVLERYLPGSRHVEIQVLFDAHGAGVHLGERDCSTQRRNQKVVEEAPGPSVDEALRARMGSAALAAASAVGYVSAGTVEMLVTDAGEAFFLEMNTRLQVEHPVTEAVTGRDLVADQLRIAAGATLADLGLTEPPVLRGHAIEARIYAEDPESGFLPATGSLAQLRWPAGIRIDTGVVEGDEVTDRYDPMLAKVIAHGATRAEAIDRLREALGATSVLGVRTNVRFLRWLLDHPVMRAGEMRTDTIASLELPGPAPLDDAHWQSAALLLGADSDEPWAGGWRLNAPPLRRLRHGDEERSTPVPTTSAGWTWTGPAAVRVGDVAHVDVEGQNVEFRLAPAPTVEDAVRHATVLAGDGSAALTAPMPGRVIGVRASAGDRVTAHQAVVVIEAMKMEHAVTAPIDGTISALLVTEGQQVQRGDLLAEVAQSA
jgi:excisionase family DNA binding protein